MQVLIYDMLYGDMEVYGGENPYQPTELVMGIRPITLALSDDTLSGVPLQFQDGQAHKPEADMLPYPDLSALVYNCSRLHTLSHTGFHSLASLLSAQVRADGRRTSPAQRLPDKLPRTVSVPL